MSAPIREQPENTGSGWKSGKPVASGVSPHLDTNEREVLAKEVLLAYENAGGMNLSFEMYDARNIADFILTRDKTAVNKALAELKEKLPGRVTEPSYREIETNRFVSDVLEAKGWNGAIDVITALIDTALDKAAPPESDNTP